MILQQIAVFIIVGLAVFAALYRLYKSYLAGPLSRHLLRRGQVKWAMKMRAQVQESGCGSCGSDSSCHIPK